MLKIVATLSLFCYVLHAGEINDATIKKMEAEDKLNAEAQAILLDPKKREEAENRTPEAKAAVKTIKKLAGSAENEQKLYQFAADIFKSLNKKTKGNTQQMESLLREALTNPEGFANSLSPEQQKVLHDLATQITGGGLKLP